MNAPQRDDARLLERAKTGDEAARQEIFSLCSPMLEAYLQKRMGPTLRRHTSISDICIETFGRAFRALDRLRPDPTLDDFQGVLFLNAHWTLADRGREAKKFQGESVAGSVAARQLPCAEPSGDGTVTREDEKEWIRLQVHRLPPEHARVIELRLDGLEFAEIAAKLGIETEAARKRFLRASVRLRKLIGKDVP